MKGPMQRFVLRAFALATALLVAGALPAHSQTAAPVKLRLAVNPGYVSFLAAFIAVDKGYFKDAGLDVDIVKFPGSAIPVMPRLARGEIDVMPMVAGPPLFNQFAEGFAAKIIASIVEAHAGYKSPSVMMVRKELWDSGALRKFSDLKGKRIEGTVAGSPCDLMARLTVAKAGLKITDVVYTNNSKTPADGFAALRNNALDVVCEIEPTASEVEAQGVAVRWLYYNDVMPWFQETYWAANGDYAKKNPEALQRFLTAILRATADMSRSNGQWTPELVATMAKWSELTPEVVSRTGGMPYVAQYGRVNLDSLKRNQQVWQDLGLVPKPVVVEGIVDTTMLSAAQKTVKVP
jgi:NitT/TauT family transport system substrate-binding protein